MIYNCYLDDSKDQNQSKLMVSAGFIGSQADWTSLRLAWNKRLRIDGLKYFKSNEYKMLEGEFARFKSPMYPPPKGREKAQAIRLDLQDIMGKRPRIRGIGISIPLEEYAEVAARPESKGVLPADPYQAALVSVMYQTVKLIRTDTENSKVAFIHDDSAEFANLFSAFTKFKEANPETAEFIEGFKFWDDKEHPPLQAADMIANYTLGIGLKGLETTGDLKVIVSEMQQNIHYLGYWSKEYILSVLRTNLMSKGKPIPLDMYDLNEDYKYTHR